MTQSLLPGRRYRPGDGAAGCTGLGRGALRLALLALIPLLWSAGGPAMAQYKVVEPGGRVTYTDRPPSFGAVALPGAPGAPSTGSRAAGDLAALSSGLPFALRQVVQRYPVRLYTAPSCAPCDAGRQLLQRRGVPLLEFSVKPGEDAELFQREVGASELPVLQVGRQRLVGFSGPEWQELLDAAGYPATSQLPPTHRAAAVRPLAGPMTDAAVTRQDLAPAADAPRAAGSPGAPGSPADAVPPARPGGFRF